MVSKVVQISLILMLCLVPLFDLATSLEEDTDASQEYQDRPISLLSSQDRGFFIENKGQLSREDILYYSLGKLRIGFSTGRVIYCIDDHDGGSIRSLAFEILFEGSNPVLPVLSEPTNDRVTFLSSSMDASNILYSHGRVTYHGIYDGIDLIYYFQRGSLKYDLIVHPGADPSDIRMIYSGVEGLNMVNGRSLEIRTLLGSVLDDELYAFQGQDQIEIGFRMIEENTVGFELSPYDHTKLLVIDPFVKHSTYLGGSEFEYLMTKPHLDAQGNVYFGGTALSKDFPTTSGVIDTNISGYDGFIVKFSADLTELLFSSYLGGSMDDEITDIYLDGNGNVYATGYTKSLDFPATRGAYDESSHIWTDGDGTTYGDAFVSKISQNGTVLSYSTFVGGDGEDGGTCIDVDAEGNAFVGGYTFSENFPTKDAFQSEYKAGGAMGAFAPDGFVLKLDPTASSLEYSTYIGGAHNRFESGIDDIYDIEVDGTGRAVICGQTGGYDYPTTSGAFKTAYNRDSGFVTRFAANGSILDFSTFIETNTKCASIAIAGDGTIYITGETISGNFPVSNGAFDTIFDGGPNDGFVLNLLSDGSSVNYATFIGGGEADISNDIKIDEDGRIWVYGATDSTSFPIRIDEKNFPDGSNGEVFLSRFSSDLSALSISFKFGGSDYDIPGGLALVGSDEMIVTGATSSTDLPTSADAYDNSLNNISQIGTDIFVTRFGLTAQRPFPPLNLSMEEGNGHLNISWSPPENAESSFITNYGVFRSINDALFKKIGTVTKDHMWFNDTDLEKGQTYYYKVCGINYMGEGTRSESISGVMMTTPGAPGDLSIISGDGYNVISWKEPADDGGDQNLRYVLDGGIEISMMDTLTNDSAETSFNHSDLINGLQYHYRVSARNSRGSGPWSKVFSSIPGTPPSEPSNPAMRWGDGYVNITWSAPLENGGFPSMNYSVYVSYDNESFLAIARGISDQWYNITSLHNGQRIYIRLTATNAKGEGRPSKVLVSTPLGLPSSPQDLVLKYWSEVVELEWAPPADDGGAAWIRYEIFMAAGDGELSSIEDDISETSLRIEDLDNGVTYHFGVRAYNIRGPGPMTPIGSVTPMSVPTRPRNVTVMGSDTSVTVSWAPPEDMGGSLVVEYWVYYGTNPDHLTGILNSSALSLTIDGLVNGDVYYFGVLCFNSEGNGPLSDIVQAIPLGLPSSPKITSILPGDGDLTVSWDAPDDLGGVAEVNYSIYVSYGGQMDLAGSGLEGDEVILTGLVNGISYRVGVAAVNPVGEGPISEMVSGRPATVPSKPGSISLMVVGDRIRVNWSAPLDDGGTPVVSYMIFREEDDQGFMLLTVVDNNTMTYMDAEIEKGTSYRYMVKAVNEMGEGQGSSSDPVSIERADGSSPFALIIGGIAVISFLGIVLFIFMMIRSKKARGSNDVQLDEEGSGMLVQSDAVIEILHEE